ncbi:polyhomeotic-like protein 2 isoform X3 [Amia ocellicauda]|uniref:polyhomeotic-like protein 2 isoform X3 n=1 Tax=Amia ocellicauda TaxID=2972642 RepID=UPI0034649B62
MESDPVPPTSSSAATSTASSTSSTSASSSNGRQTVPQIVYSGIPDRQTVQVIQQALHRQPNTAAQYLQQMYAAQQQHHLMLQTAALQQQHLSSAQLQSLAAVQQASIAAGRQGSNQNGTTSQQTASSQTTINLATSPAAAQLISRAQSVNSTPTGITQQAVLLGNTSSPGLTASQAQMYLRAQMAQQSNLVQVARSLGRAVPLSPQLIFTPTATVTAVQPEASAQTAGQQSTNAQYIHGNTQVELTKPTVWIGHSWSDCLEVQNLAIRSQQGVSSAQPSQGQLQSLTLKQATASQQSALALHTAGHHKGAGQGLQSLGGKGGSSDTPSEGGKKGESPPSMETRVVNVSRNMTTVSNHPLISSAYTQIQPHQLIQHQQHKQHQFVIQQQTQLPQRSQAQLLHTASIQPQLQTQAQTVQALTIQPAVAAQPQSQQCTIPVLPKPPSHQPPGPSPQATIFHSTVSPQTLQHNGQPTPMHQAPQPKPQPVQLAAVNLQIQPTPNSQTPRLIQDSVSKDKGAAALPREACPNPSVLQVASAAPPTTTTTEQRKPDASKPTVPGKGTAERVNAKPGPGTAPAMTSGNGNNAPTVTGSTPQNGENKPPQAIVKPQILTHVIEGFVIQEGAEPFPKQKQQLQSDPEKTPQSNPPNTTDSEMEDLSQQELKDQEEDEPKLKCELCGRVDFAYKFKRSKRFCSMACAKRYNVGCTKRVGLFHPDRSKNTAKSDGPKHRRRRSRKGSLQSLNKEVKKQPSTPLQTLGGLMSSPLPSHPSQGESSQCSDISSYEEPPSPLSAASSGAPRHQGDRGSDGQEGHGRELPLHAQHFQSSDPTKWNVEDVYKFIRSLPGCQEIADEFRSQEIDGQAMLLLKEDHLMSAMNIKLGPALKIYARISMLKDS